MTQKPTYEDLMERVKELGKKVSGSRKVDAALRESEGILGGVLQSIGDHISLLDKNLNILWANETSRKIFGNNIVGKKCYEAFHQREVPCDPHPCLTLKAFQDGEIHEHDTQVIDKDGKPIFFHCTANVALRDKAGNPTAVVEISRDITDAIRADEALRKANDGLEQRVEARTIELLKANERLQESEERFRAICDTARDSIFLKDRFLRYTHVNPAMERLFQLPFEELVGKSDEDLFGKEAGKHVRKVDSRVLAGEIIQEEHTKPVGEIFFTFHVIKVPIRDKSGEIVGLCGIARDITERKQAEKMLKKAHDELEKRVQQRTAELVRLNDQLKIEIKDRKRAEKQIKASLREKEVLLSEIHHRVKNNFEIISSFLDISSMQTENRENPNLWGDARARIHSMALIHDQLYQSDRFDRIHMERHVQEMVDYLSHIYAGNGRRIVSVIEPSEVYLSVGQAIPCALVLNELISNAFKHAFRKKKKGTVRVSISTPDSATVLVKVKDDGDGIPEKTDNYRRTGLGLKMARHLVSGQLKGKMRIKNDSGTEISIQFKRSNDGKKHE
ncbi:MAG: PAS domain-containing protein [Deltaproteobacteria bacterium]|nr:PAS domain-containing protein [Deltaproteobacteria bacterium]